MSKVAVVYWSSSGNTEAMAAAVAEGAKAAGAEVTVFETGDFSADKITDFDGFAFGCPAMGDEVLEESEFEPLFTECENRLEGKKTVLFGSYGWGDGQWMRDWEERCQGHGIRLVSESVICQEEPDEEGLEQCRSLGAAVVS